MSSKQEESESLGAGCVFWLLLIPVWLVVTYPWLLLLPIALLLCVCVILGNRAKKVRRLHPPQTVAPTPAPRTIAARPPVRTITPAPPPKVIPRQSKPAPPDFIPKDREYNRYLARTWDEEFEALVKKREQIPPS
jgi:hypothetical protein